MGMFVGMLSERDTGFLLLFFAVLFLAIELKFYTHMISGIVGAALLGFGLALLLRGEVPIAIDIAISAALGVIILFLGNLGMKASRTKRLTGLQTLLGEMGVSRTPLNPEGTVFVNGEYWQARADHAIEAGKKVRVEKIENMTIWVTEV